MYPILSKKQFVYWLLFAILMQIVGISKATAKAGPTPFKTTWKVANNNIIIPTSTFAGAYNYTVNYRKQGTTPFTTISGQTGNCTISGLTNDDIIEVEITGVFPHFYMNSNATEKGKLLSIEAWGNQNWKSMLRSFQGCSNLVYNATDSPDLSSVTSMFAMFYECSKFNGAIGGWNTSNVTDMGNLFALATIFNQPVGSWNTDKVASTFSMFFFASKFNQPLTNWNTSKVTDMAGMFSGATDFNQDLSVLELDAVNPTRLGTIIKNSGLSVANYDATLTGWLSQNKTGLTLDAAGLKYCASETARTTLITPVASGGKGWTITGDAKFCGVPTIVATGTPTPFSACAGTASTTQTFTVSGTNLTANISVTAPTGYEVSTASGSGFANSVTLTQSGGTVSNTTLYARLTNSATGSPSGNIALTSSGATTQNVAVSGTVNALPSITLGSVSNITTTATTFSLPYTATTGSPNQYSITAGTPNAIAGFSAVSNAALTGSPLSVTVPASAANTYNFVATVSNTTTGCVSANNNFTVMVAVPSTPFKTTWKVADGNIFIPTLNTSGPYNYTVKYRKKGTIPYTTISNQTDDYIILGLTNGDEIEVEITGIFPHFYMNNNTLHGPKLLSIDAWGNQVWKSMSRSFAGCSNLTYNATDNPDLSAVTDMSGMFTGCKVFNGNIGSWNTSNVTNMRNMFYFTDTFNQNIDSWSTSNVTDMSNMFSNATAFNGNIGSWDTRKVVIMGGMFNGATKFNKPLTNWNTEKVTNMFVMFNNATTFNQDLSVLEINAVTDMTSMLDNSGLSVANYDATLTGWLSQNKTNLSLGATGLKYCASEANRTTLITPVANGGKGWTITGDAKLCAVPTIVVTGVPTPFTACNGTSSAIQSFTVSGTDLTEGIVIGKLTGFQVSLTPGTTFENTLTLPQSGGTVPTTTIYVRMSRLATGSPSGNIAITSVGAITKNVVLSGTVKALPVLNPSTNSPVCSGQTLFLYAKGEIQSGESPTDTYTWTGVNSFTANTQNPFIGNVGISANGVYTVSAVSSTNCSATATVMVTVKETPTLVVSNFTNPTPENNPDGTISFTTNLPNASFSLSYGSTGSPRNVTVSSGAFTLSGLVSGVYGNFAVTNNGCTGRNNTEVTLLSTPFTLVKSITTGNWEANTTWNIGRVPKAGDVVIIDGGHVVTINGNSTIKDLEVRGQLIYGAVGIIINLGL